MLLGYAEIIAQRKTYKTILWRTFLIHDLTAIIFMKIMAIYFCYNNQNSCNTVPKRQSCKSFCQCPVLVRYHPAMLSFFWLRSFPFLVQFYSTINSYFTTQEHLSSPGILLTDRQYHAIPIYTLSHLNYALSEQTCLTLRGREPRTDLHSINDNNGMKAT